MGILEGILLAVSIVALVLKHWDEVKKWLNAVIDGVYKKLKEIIHAADVYIQELKDKLSALKYKLYYEEQGKWIEEITTKKIEISELPQNIREKFVVDEEVLITNEMERELNLTI